MTSQVKLEQKNKQYFTGENLRVKQYLWGPYLEYMYIYMYVSVDVCVYIYIC